ncbi:MAG: hypothetical protein HYT50_00905 [Candidatus Wildermuthbacteria bacterium]|nr:hypothetical protein [Candidatus Wildermuthbacteria bacterium]
MSLRTMNFHRTAKITGYSLLGLALTSALLFVYKPNAPIAEVHSLPAYSFYKSAILEEASSRNSSKDPDWWLDSGGRIYFHNGIAKTIQGALFKDSLWHVAYKRTNPRDTDQGTHPQNIFRLTTKGTWMNFKEQAYFYITQHNQSSSPYRNESNGLFLFNRYQNSDNLYYTGIRVDGAAVIKKKQNGAYATLAYVPGIFKGAYDRDASPNLIDKNTWIGLKSHVQTNLDGSVQIKLYMDKGKTGTWLLVAQALDIPGIHGSPITKAGYAGIRTDFMDVLFRGFHIEGI